MGADRFVAFYGLKFQIDDEDTVDEPDERTDPRFAAAKNAKLHTYVGRLTDGNPYFFFVGRSLGVYGIQDKFEQSFETVELLRIANETDEKLRLAGLKGDARFWFQLEAQY